MLIAIGGWNDGNDSGFEQMAANAGARTTFVNNVVNLVNQYNLDGVDIDWEYPDPGTSGNNFTALMSQLSSAMHSRGKLLTAAVVSGGGTAQGVQPAVFGMVDFLNIMTYDGGTPHANYNWTIDNINGWKSRGPAGQQGGRRRAVLQPARRHPVQPDRRAERGVGEPGLRDHQRRAAVLQRAADDPAPRRSGRWPTPAG